MKEFIIGDDSGLFGKNPSVHESDMWPYRCYFGTT